MVLREKVLAWDFEGWNDPQRGKLMAAVFGAAGAYIAGLISGGTGGLVSELGLVIVGLTTVIGVTIAAITD